MHIFWVWAVEYMSVKAKSSDQQKVKSNRSAGVNLLLELVLMSFLSLSSQVELKLEDFVHPRRSLLG